MKNEIVFVGTVIMYAMLVIIAVLFYTAYSNESKSVVVTINEYGEAKSEAFFVVPFFAVVGTITTVIIIKDCCKELII